MVTTFFDFPMLFNTETGEPSQDMNQMDTNLAGCTCLRMSPNDKLIAACSSDGSVKVSVATSHNRPVASFDSGGVLRWTKSKTPSNFM